MRAIHGIGIPKYLQLAQHLRAQIHSGMLPPGTALPTEAELCSLHSLARGTVRKALEQLANERAIRSVQGLGSFVAASDPRALPLRFIEMPQARRFRVLAQALEPATPATAARLHLPVGEPVIHIAQVALFSGRPAWLAERRLPHGLCPALLRMDLTRRSVHDALAAAAERPPLRATMDVESHALEPSDAAALGVPEDTAAIHVLRLSYTAPNEPAVWFRGVFLKRYASAIELT